MAVSLFADEHMHVAEGVMVDGGTGILACHSGVAPTNGGPPSNDNQGGCPTVWPYSCCSFEGTSPAPFEMNFPRASIWLTVGIAAGILVPVARIRRKPNPPPFGTRRKRWGGPRLKAGRIRKLRAAGHGNFSQNGSGLVECNPMAC